MTPPIGWEHHAAYGAAWVSFGLAHSLLAGDVLKRAFGAGYRLAFNLIAVVHMAGVFAVGAWLLGPVAAPPTSLTVLHLVGWAMLLIALRDYDLGLFSGLKQLRAAQAGQPLTDDDGPLVVEGLHRYVRHPLYVGAFVILWSGAYGALGVATAAWGSTYLLLGTWSEERRLSARFGDDYAAYRKQVPAFLPWKGRAP